MAGRPRKFAKELTTDERTMLETIAHSRTEEKRRVERAEVILGCAAEMSNVAIAEKLHISKPTVVKILKKWTMFGVNSALEDLQRTGRPAKIRIEAKAWLISLAYTKPEDIPGAPMTQQWTISALTKYVRSNCLKQQLPELEGVQESTVWSILNKRFPILCTTRHANQRKRLEPALVPRARASSCSLIPSGDRGRVWA